MLFLAVLAYGRCEKRTVLGNRSENVSIPWDSTWHSPSGIFPVTKNQSRGFIKTAAAPSRQVTFIVSPTNTTISKRHHRGLQAAYGQHSVPFSKASDTLQTWQWEIPWKWKFNKKVIFKFIRVIFHRHSWWPESNNNNNNNNNSHEPLSDSIPYPNNYICLTHGIAIQVRYSIETFETRSAKTPRL